MHPVQVIRRVEATDRCVQDGAELVTTLAKGLDVLAVLAGGELLGNQQIAQRVGLSKATASRLCATMTALGYLRLDEGTRKYAMGARLLAMGATVQHRSGLLRMAKPHMTLLAHATGMVVGMGTRDRLGMVCLDLAHDDGVSVGTSTVGSVLPMAETALGLAYLAHVGVAERIPLLRQLQAAYGRDWPLVRERIEDASEQYRRQGFVVRSRSCEAGVTGVAAAMDLPGHLGVVAFTCATDVDGPDVTARLQRAGETLRAMLARMSRGAMP
jgi:DNA-binding IclR family transcriptional regulator